MASGADGRTDSRAGGLQQKATGWAELALTVLSTPYPYAAAHVSGSADDVDVTPQRLHPAFHGCLDWHSSTHMQWSLVRLLSTAGPELEPTGVRERAVELLSHRLTEPNVAVEVGYLREHPGFERPYGWAWAAMLAAATVSCPEPAAAGWAAATRPLADVIADLVLGWLPWQAYPVRHGVHGNTAFGLCLLLEAYGDLGRADVTDALRATALRWFADDREHPSAFEPSGSDFLSPVLTEVELMRRVLGPDELVGWVEAFLPGLGAGAHQHLLDVPVVLDRSDGQLVHLYGLALSRAWQLRGYAGSLPVADERVPVLHAAADRQVAFATAEVTAGHFMSTHWLVSFALLAASSGAGIRG